MAQPISSLPSLMEVDTSNVATLNEAQRKKLPSWIRAGLEKMEKDKQKKEQEDERRKRFEERKRQERLEQAEELAKDPAKSKFDVDNSEDGESYNGDLDSRDTPEPEPSDNGHDEGASRRTRF